MILVSEPLMEAIRFIKGVCIIFNGMVIILNIREIYRRIKSKEYGMALSLFSISVALGFAIFILYKSM